MQKLECCLSLGHVLITKKNGKGIKGNVFKFLAQKLRIFLYKVL